MNNNIHKAATHWLTRLDKGLSTTEKRALVAWINQDKTHYIAIKELSKTHSLTYDFNKEINELPGIFTLNQPHKAKATTHSQNNILFFLLFAFLSIFLVLKSLALFPFDQPDLRFQSLKSVIGEQKFFTLSDGSQLTLNTNTEVNVEFTESYRKLTLVKGEAKFDVAKDKTRPFSVTVGSNAYTALGTIFNIQKNNEHSSEMIVSEGKVLVTPAHISLNNLTEHFNVSSTSNDFDNKKLNAPIIKAQQKIHITYNSAPQISTLSLNDIQQDLAWQQGALIFDGQPLNSAINDINRYSPVQLNIKDNHLRNIKISGYFKSGDIDGLLQALEHNFDIKAVKTSPNEILLTTSTTQVRFN